MIIVVEILKILFFWVGTAIAMTTFKENEAESDILLKYILIYTIINVFASIFLIAINDFRITLIATISFLCIHKILLNIFKRKFFKITRKD